VLDQERPAARVGSSRDDGTPGSPTGSLRLTRTAGTTITAYYWSGSAWAELQSATGPSGPISSFSLSIFNGYHPQDGMQIAFDDFALSAPDTLASASLPAVTTAAVSGGTATGATGGGEVTSDGGAAVTAREICWSTSASPAVGTAYGLGAALRSRRG
jgi:hypothetical protein